MRIIEVAYLGNVPPVKPESTLRRISFVAIRLTYRLYPECSYLHDGESEVMMDANLNDVEKYLRS